MGARRAERSGVPRTLLDLGEADSFEFRSQRGAFEGDRVRDAAMLVWGYRIIRITHRRLSREPDKLATKLRLLPTQGKAESQIRGMSGRRSRHGAAASGERGQGTVEWIALLLLIALLFAGLVAAGSRVPGTGLARAIASRILCAAAMADGCGDEPALIAVYGDEIGRLVRRHMPILGFEQGSRALPVDFRRCRSSACGDGDARGLIHRSDAQLPVTAFVHVVDCREGEAGAAEGEGADCSGERAGNLYIQYWTYYADSATLRGLPVVGERGYHKDDWEGVELRFGPGGDVEQRASSHNGFNYARSRANWGSDAGIEPLRDAAEALGARPHNGWGPETHLLLVSGGSHAGNVGGTPNIDRLTPGRSVHLVPLEPIASEGERYRFAISPPWLKRVWRDPEAEGTS